MKALIVILSLFASLFAVDAFACQKYANVVQDINGTALGNTLITIRPTGTSNNATLYTDATCLTTRSNPFTNNADGYFTFYAKNGRYDAIFSKAAYGFAAANTSDILLDDPQNTQKIGDPAMFGYVDNVLTLQAYGDTGSSPPTGVQQANRFIAQSKGDNTTFRGLSTGYFEARDRTDVTGSNKGVLYGLSLSVVPIAARNNVPFDDVDGLTIENTTGTAGAKATDAIYVANNFNIFPASSEWYSIFTSDANADVGIQLGGRLANFGIDLTHANIPSSNAIRLQNLTYIYSRNNINSGDVRLMGLDGNNILQVGESNVSGTKVNTWFGTTVPTNQSGSTYTVGFGDNFLTFTGSGCTVTLPAASSFSARILTLRTIVAFTVISASSNVVPLAGGSAGTAILAATAGKWAQLVSDGTNWQIMSGN